LPRPPVPLHGGNEAVHPAEWSLTHEQLGWFLGEWTRILREDGRVDHYTGYHFCNDCVTPWTAGTGCSVALLLNPDPKEAQVMISHAWGQSMFEVHEILSGLAWYHTIGANKSLRLWFCICAIYQPEDGYGPSVDAQVHMHPDPFVSVIDAVKSRGSRKMAVLHTSKAEVYGRLWCVYEIDHAVTNEVDVVPLLSWEAAHAFFARGWEAVEDWSKVDCKTAKKCWKETDTDMITEKVLRKPGGFSRLNEVIGGQRINAAWLLGPGRWW